MWLPQHATIFTAELHSIYMAISRIRHKPGKYIILTDSLSAIRALQSYQVTRHYTLAAIYNLLESLDTNKVCFEWIPSHMGIKGNDKADKLANLSTNIALTKEIAQAKTEMNSTIARYCANEWQTKCEKLGRTLTSFKPKIGPTAYSESERPQQVMMTRLRMGTTYFTDGHYFKKLPPNSCPKCDTRATVKHILTECLQLTEERQELINWCNKHNITFTLHNLLAPPMPITIIVSFLSKAGIVINQI